MFRWPLSGETFCSFHKGRKWLSYVIRISVKTVWFVPLVEALRGLLLQDLPNLLVLVGQGILHHVVLIHCCQGFRSRVKSGSDPTLERIKIDPNPTKEKGIRIVLIKNLMKKVAKNNQIFLKIYLRWGIADRIQFSKISMWIRIHPLTRWGSETLCFVQRWKLINVVYFLFSAQSELYGGLLKPSVAAAPLEWRKEINNIY